MPSLLIKNQISTVECLKGGSWGRVVFLPGRPLGSGGEVVRTCMFLSAWLVSLLKSLLPPHWRYMGFSWRGVKIQFFHWELFRAGSSNCLNLLPGLGVSLTLQCLLLLLLHNFVLLHSAWKPLGFSSMTSKIHKKLCGFISSHRLFSLESRHCMQDIY